MKILTLSLHWQIREVSDGTTDLQEDRDSLESEDKLLAHSHQREAIDNTVGRQTGDHKYQVLKRLISVALKDLHSPLIHGLSLGSLTVNTGPFTKVNSKIRWVGRYNVTLSQRVSSITPGSWLSPQLYLYLFLSHTCLEPGNSEIITSPFLRQPIEGYLWVLDILFWKRNYIWRSR